MAELMALKGTCCWEVVKCLQIESRGRLIKHQEMVIGGIADVPLNKLHLMPPPSSSGIRLLPQLTQFLMTSQAPLLPLKAPLTQCALQWEEAVVVVVKLLLAGGG